MAGLYVEEFAVGRIFEHEIRRTVTESDNERDETVCRCTRQALMLRKSPG